MSGRSATVRNPNKGGWPAKYTRGERKVKKFSEKKMCLGCFPELPNFPKSLSGNYKTRPNSATQKKKNIQIMRSRTIFFKTLIIISIVFVQEAKVRKLVMATTLTIRKFRCKQWVREKTFFIFF